MIPLKAEQGKMGPRVRLIWKFPKDKVQQEWTVELVPSELRYPSLGDAARDTDNAIRSIVDPENTQSFVCALANSTSYIFVTDQTYSDGKNCYKSTVWLPS